MRVARLISKGMRARRVLPFGPALALLALSLGMLPGDAMAAPVVVAVAAGAVSSAVASAIGGAVLFGTFTIGNLFGSIAGFAVSALGGSLFGNQSGAKQDTGFDGAGSFQSEARGRLQVVRSAIETRKWVLGEVMVSGPLVYAEVSSPPGGNENNYLHLVIPLASHEVQEIGEIYFGDKLVGALDGSGNVTTGDFAGYARIKKHLGATSQTADTDLVAESDGLWTTDHRLRGVAYIYVRLEWSASVYPGGIPNIKALVKGRLLYDPRDAGTRYHNNWALGVRAYLQAAAIDGGLECEDDEIDDTVFSAGANTCDERVTMATHTNTFTADASTDILTLAETENTIAHGDGVQVTGAGSPGGTLPTGLSAGVTYYWIRKSATTGQLATTAANALAGTAIDFSSAGSGTLTISHIDQARYTLNGTIDTGKRPLDILTALMSAAAGVITYPAGTFRVYPAAYASPSITLDEDDLRAPMQVTWRMRRADLFNAVRGTFAAPGNFWQPSDFPPMENSTYATQDGGEVIYRDIDLPYTTDAVRAQRLAKVHLEKSRQGIVVQMPAKMSAFNLAIWDTVMITNTARGWSSKVFRVTDWKLGADGIGVDLTLREESSASYDWSSGDATVIDPAPDTNLPSIAVAALTGLTLSSGTADLFIAGDGTVVSRIKASWTAAPNIFVQSGGHIEVQFKKSADSAWQDAADVAGDATQTYLGPVDDGVNYDVRARAVNNIGVEGAWATVTAHTVAGKSAPPTDPSGFTAQQTAPGTVLFGCDSINDADLKRIEVRLLDYDDETWANGIPVCNILKGSTSTTGAVRSGTWTFLARAFDFSENASTNVARADLTVTEDGFTVIASVDCAPEWLGCTLTNFSKHWTGVLVPKSTVMAGGAMAEFDAAAVGTGSVVTEGVFRVVSGGGGSWASCRSTIGKSSGKWEWKVPVVSSPSAFIVIGIGTSSATLTNYTGFDAYGIGYVGVNGFLIGNSTLLQSGATYGAGDHVRVQLDFDAGTVKFYKNDVLQFTEALGSLAGSTLYPMFTVFSAGDALYLNTGKDGSFTPASGFSKLHSDTIGWDTFDEWLPSPYTTCTAELAEIDKGIDGNVRVYGDIVAALGPGVTSGTANPQMQIDSKLAAGSYDGFEDWSAGFLDFRYLKSKLVLDTSLGHAKVSGFNVVIDAIARQESMRNQTINATGTTFTFDAPFHVTPAINAHNDGATPLLPTHGSDSSTGTTIHLFNTSGSEVGGTGGFTATGV